MRKTSSPFWAVAMFTAACAPASTPASSPTAGAGTNAPSAAQGAIATPAASRPGSDAPIVGAPAGDSGAPAATTPTEDRSNPVEKITVASRDIVAAPDRSPEDRKLDAGRQPARLLTFLGVKPGMRVGEIAAGGGYTTELLARAVGPSGVVYAENPKFILEKFAEAPWRARLAKPVNKNVIRSDREPSDPFPPEAHDLDLVVDVLFYHDTVWLGVDRDAMNAAIFSALKHGGAYVVVDHRARGGAGIADVKTLHRIEERVVREEVERAGFRLESTASFLESSTDTYDWNASPSKAGDRRGTSDRFVLRFVKP